MRGAFGASASCAPPCMKSSRVRGWSPSLCRREHRRPAMLVLPGSIQAVQETAIYERVDGYLKRRLVNIGLRGVDCAGLEDRGGGARIPAKTFYSAGGQSCGRSRSGDSKNVDRSAYDQRRRVVAARKYADVKFHLTHKDPPLLIPSSASLCGQGSSGSQPSAATTKCGFRSSNWGETTGRRWKWWKGSVKKSGC